MCLAKLATNPWQQKKAMYMKRGCEFISAKNPRDLTNPNVLVDPLQDQYLVQETVVSTGRAVIRAEKTWAVDTQERVRILQCGLRAIRVNDRQETCRDQSNNRQISGISAH